MKSSNRAKSKPEIGRSTERLVEDRHMKPKWKAQAGTAVCAICGAIGMQKHWFIDPKMHENLLNDPLVRYVHCPGCQRVKNKVYEGEVNLKSSLLVSNQEMVYGTLYKAAAKAYLHNPLSRIASIEEHGDSIRILTTTCTLAERLGKAIHRALKGQIEIKPSPGEKFVFVNWQRSQ